MILIKIIIISLNEILLIKQEQEAQMFLPLAFQRYTEKIIMRK